MQKQWLIRDSQQRLFGPFTSQHIIGLIARSIFEGNEEAAEYPGGEWQKLSNHEVFGRKLSESLTKGGSRLTDVERLKELSVREEANFLGATDFGDAKKEKTIGKAHRQETKILAFPRQFKKFLSTSKKSEPRKKRKTSNLIPVILVLAGLLLLYQFMSPQKGSQRVHLIEPNMKSNNELSAEQLQAKMESVWGTFGQDHFSALIDAEKQAVQMVEMAPRAPSSLGLLCLIYKELWPHTYQDSQDLNVVLRVVQQSSRVDPLGTQGLLCRVTQMLVNGQFGEASGAVDSGLAQDDKDAGLYLLKGELLFDKGEFATSISYFQKAESLKPHWLKAYFLEGRARRKLGRFDEAQGIFSNIIKANSSHAGSALEWGAMLFFDLKKPDEAERLLRHGFSLGETVISPIDAKAAYALSLILKEESKKNEALKWALHALEKDPMNSDIRILVAALGGNVSDSKTKSSCREFMNLGDIYYSNANYLGAQGEFKAAFECDEKNALAAYRAGLSLWKIYQTTDAISWMKTATRVDPELIEGYAALADYLAQKYNFTEAQRVLELARKKAPKRFEIYRAHAAVELRRNNYSGAIAYAQQTLKYFDTDVETHLILSEAQLKAGDVQAAYQTVSRALALDKGSAQVNSSYGKILASYQSVDAGERYLQDLLTAAPQVNVYRYTIGQIYFSEEKFKEAEETLKQATEIQPKFKEAFLLLGEVYSKQDRVRDSLEAVLAAASIDPSDPAPLFEIGKIYLISKKYDQAAQQFRRTIEANSNFPRAHYFLGKTLLEIGDPESALKEATIEKKMNPRLSDGYVLAAESHMKSHRYSKAVGEFQQVLKLKPKGADIYIKMAQAYRMSGNLDSAAQMLKTAAGQESGNADVYKEQGAVYEMKGDSESAARAYEIYLQLLPNAPDRAVIMERIKNLGG